MHINEVQALAERLRSLQRRTYTFGKNRDQIIDEVGMIAEDLEAYVAKMDHEMDMAHLEEQASRNDFQKEYDNA